jgi:hypothetical protein
VSLSADESAALERAAAARGMRPSELVREAVLDIVGRPVAPPVTPDSAAALAPVLARLDALATTLAGLESLVDIANSLGVLAGSIVPEDSAAASFGPDED